MPRRGWRILISLPFRRTGTSANCGDFDLRAAKVVLRALLARYNIKGDPGDATVDEIVRLASTGKYGANPLSLRLAAQVFAREGLKGIEDAVSRPRRRWQKTVAAEWIQGMLQARIVEQLSEPLQRIANPGLIVRRITSGVLCKVLAAPCQLGQISKSQADDLLEQLRQEVAIVEPAEQGG